MNPIDIFIFSGMFFSFIGFLSFGIMKLVNSKERVDPSEAFAVLFAIIVGAIFWPISLVGVLLYIPVHYLTKKTNKGKR